MKILIEIPEEAKQAFDCAESNDLKCGYYDHGGVIGNAIKNGTPIPDNATNGDVIKAMFPKVKFEEYEDEVHHCIIAWFFGDFYTGSFPWTWWNTPYKAESEE